MTNVAYREYQCTIATVGEPQLLMVATTAPLPTWDKLNKLNCGVVKLRTQKLGGFLSVLNWTLTVPTSSCTGTGSVRGNSVLKRTAASEIKCEIML